MKMITVIKKKDYSDKKRLRRFIGKIAAINELPLSQLLQSRHSGFGPVSSLAQVISREKADWMPDRVRHDEKSLIPCSNQGTL
jgi:hypothetical protein